MKRQLEWPTRPLCCLNYIVRRSLPADREVCIKEERKACVSSRSSEKLKELHAEWPLGTDAALDGRLGILYVYTHSLRSQPEGCAIQAGQCLHRGNHGAEHARQAGRPQQSTHNTACCAARAHTRPLGAAPSARHAPNGTYAYSWGSTHCNHCIIGTYAPWRVQPHPTRALNILWWWDRPTENRRIFCADIILYQIALSKSGCAPPFEVNVREVSPFPPAIES